MKSFHVGAQPIGAFAINCTVQRIAGPRPAARIKAAFIALAALVFAAIPSFNSARAQSVMPDGGGSYASFVPAVDGTTDAYYGLTADEISTYYGSLHMSPSLVGQPIPTNHWWTDMLIGDRSPLNSSGNGHILTQDPFGGNIWFYPGMINPGASGLAVYYPNSWLPANANGNPQGAINSGTALNVNGDVPYHIPSGDVLIADFETGYPSGTVRTGNAFAATPSTGSGLTGMMGGYCASTRDGGNGVTGTCTLPSFTVSKHYLNFLMCGGTWAGTSVNLVVGGTTVLTVSGSDSLTFNWTTWDISPWNGQAATIQIVDSVTAGWGFVAADQFVESDSNNPVGRFGGTLIATNSVITNWGDWNVDFQLPDAYGDVLAGTMVRGEPFTWTTWTGMNPQIVLGGTGTVFYDVNGNQLNISGTSFTSGAFAFTYKGCTYGIFLPDNTQCNLGGSGATSYIEPQLSGSNNYMVIGYLPATTNLSEFNTYAFARPTNTQISWSWDKVNGIVNTTWTITATALKGTNTQVIQGWLPHHYDTTTQSIPFKTYTYLTPRGVMKVAVGSTFQIGFPFNGVAPVLPAPQSTGTTNDYQPARMLAYMNSFAPGTLLGDTYWTGKALAQTAQYMARAQQIGDTADFTRCKSALEASLTNWFSYTPGESEGLFAYYPDWHALIGFNASYGTQAFNDLHFHYGYYAMALATLGLYDQTFLSNYGPIMKDIVKTYGNWDRTDTTEPFLRMFDVWEGHDNAGGTSSASGENQESSSEAMQSWAGMFLLGEMLGDDTMAGAGAMGYSMESCADNEYWEDIYQKNFPAQYGKAYSANCEAWGVNYGTFFSADPGWIYGIQYTPKNHFLNYLTRYNPGNVIQSKYAAIWTERAAWYNSYPAWSGTTTYTSTSPWVGYSNILYGLSGTAAYQSSTPPPQDTSHWTVEGVFTDGAPDDLGSAPGDEILCFESFFDPNTACAQFDTYYANNEAITNGGDAGATYYEIQANRMLGTQDFTTTFNPPTGAAYVNPSTGVRTYVFTNPSSSTQTVSIYKSGASTGTMTVAGLATVNTTNPNFTATAPGIPQAVTAASGNSQINVSWAMSQYATSYTVERATTSGGPYTTIGTVNAPGYSDTSGSNGVTYYYVVTAANSVGSSAISSEVNALFIPTPAPPASLTAVSGSGGIVLNWSPSTYATSYNILRTTSSNGTYTNIASTSGTTYTDTTVTANKTYYYVVQAANAAGASGNSVQAKAAYVPPPTAPAGFTAILGNGYVTLSWTAVSTATSYNIQRASVSGGPYTVVGSGTATTFNDSTVSNFQTYYYVVAGVNSGGAGANSTQASVQVVPAPIIGINCGGTNAVGQYAADNSYTGGTATTKTGTINTSAVTWPAPQAVYLSNRFGVFTYNLTGLTPNTNYNLRLHFAEVYFTGTGERVFNVIVSGTTVLPSFDIFAVSGTSFKANVQTVPFNSGTGGQLVITTTAIKDNPQINAIEVRPLAASITSSLAATGTNGTAFSYQIAGTNSPTFFSATGLPSGLSVSPSTGLISGTPTATGTTTVAIAASNAGGSGTANLVLTILPPPPVINSAGSITGTNGTAFSYQITATNGPTSFNAAGLLGGLSVSPSTGLISGTPTATGTSTATVYASNATGTGTANLVITILPPPPVITSAGSITGTNGAAFSYQIAGTNSPTSFGATGSPSGLSVSPSTGLISGTPTATGTTTVAIAASNAGGSGTANVVITILQPAPVITSAGSITGTNGTAFSYQISASNSPTSFNAAGLPGGLSVSPSTGLISGTPTATGTSTATIYASNATGTGTANVVITILQPAPAISSAGSITGTNGTAFSYQIGATNSPTSFNASGLPGGLSVSPSTGLISGTPTATGTSTATIYASNATGTGTANVLITILQPAPVISSAGSITGTNGTAFSYQITATNNPTSFNATGLPGGLLVSPSTGLISGTPTATGSATATIYASNATGTGTASLAINVLPPAPVINSATSVSGTISTAFSYQITATNSPTSFNATGLPSGLSVNTGNGLISGTATASGTSAVTLYASNATGTGTTSLTLVIIASDTNLALNQSASASSTQAPNVASNGNDSSQTTRWTASGTTYPQWWIVNLGAVKTLDLVNINWYNASTRAYKYTIDVSTDGTNYTTVFNNTNNTTDGNTSNPISATGQYVRITMTGCSVAGGYASFYDCEVFGH